VIGFAGKKLRPDDFVRFVAAGFVAVKLTTDRAAFEYRTAS